MYCSECGAELFEDVELEFHMCTDCLWENSDAATPDEFSELWDPDDIDTYEQGD